MDQGQAFIVRPYRDAYDVRWISLKRALPAKLSASDRLVADMSALAMGAMTVKKDFVETNEFDTGLRRSPNFGHIFGHGIEYASKGRIPHGITVAYGMECANAYAEQLGILVPEVRARIGLIVCGLVDGSELREVSASRIVSGTAQGKASVRRSRTDPPGGGWGGRSG
ncbi:hypothetical protein [Streptomyces sp. NPDC096142]|uniref:3-dehydroquinate synthase family protein n=1 Tax=Streptomyces sp. NPDC096142 TaxID=3366077 RepID=UPI00381780A3